MAYSSGKASIDLCSSNLMHIKCEQKNDVSGSASATFNCSNSVTATAVSLNVDVQASVQLTLSTLLDCKMDYSLLARTVLHELLQTPVFLRQTSALVEEVQTAVSSRRLEAACVLDRKVQKAVDTSLAQGWTLLAQTAEVVSALRRQAAQSGSAMSREEELLCTRLQESVTVLGENMVQLEAAYGEFSKVCVSHTATGAQSSTGGTLLQRVFALFSG